MKKRILVTGANKGIGLAIVAAILEEHEDTFVLLGSRDAGRGQAAREGLLEAHPEWARRVEVLSIDVSSDDSVSDAAHQTAARFDGEAAPLYGVVNNAGIGLRSGGLASILNVNARGVHRVCQAFVPLLSAEAGRIVNVTSASGPNFVRDCSPARQEFFMDASVDWPRLEALMNEAIALQGAEAFASAGLGGGNAYGLSKACANTYTLMLARQHPNLRINACTPGFIETDMTRPYAELNNKTPAEMGMKAPAQGARSTMFLLFGEPEGNGHYYGSDAKRSPLHKYRSPGDPPYTGR